MASPVCLDSSVHLCSCTSQGLSFILKMDWWYHPHGILIKCDKAYKKLLRQSGYSVGSGLLPLRADKNARKTIEEVASPRHHQRHLICFSSPTLLLSCKCLSWVSGFPHCGAPAPAVALLGGRPHHRHQLCTQHQAPARSAPRQARLNLPFCLGVAQSTHLLLPFHSELRLPLQRLHPHTQLGTHCAPTATSTSVLSAAPSPATAASPGNLLEMQTPGPPTTESETPRGRAPQCCSTSPRGF